MNRRPPPAGPASRVRTESVERIGLPRRTQRRRDLEPRDVALPAAVGELNDVPAVVLVHATAELAPERDLVVAVDTRIVRHDPASQVDRHPRRDDRPHPTPGELELPIDPGLRAGTVVEVEAPGDVRAKDPVGRGEAAKPQRLEQKAGHSGSDGNGAPLYTESISWIICSRESKRLSS